LIPPLHAQDDLICKYLMLHLLSRVEPLKQPLTSVSISEEVKKTALQIYHQHMEFIWTFEDKVIFKIFLRVDFIFGVIERGYKLGIA